MRQKIFLSYKRFNVLGYNKRGNRYQGVCRTRKGQS